MRAKESSVLFHLQVATGVVVEARWSMAISWVWETNWEDSGWGMLIPGCPVALESGHLDGWIEVRMKDQWEDENHLDKNEA